MTLLAGASDVLGVPRRNVKCTSETSASALWKRSILVTASVPQRTSSALRSGSSWTNSRIQLVASLTCVSSSACR